MARERKPQLITLLLELEDNCGAVLAKAKKQIRVKSVTMEAAQEEFKKFVDGLPDELEL